MPGPIVQYYDPNPEAPRTATIVMGVDNLLLVNRNQIFDFEQAGAVKRYRARILNIKKHFESAKTALELASKAVEAQAKEEEQ